ncbi:BrnT family toxin [Gammaproteobacteria bacterium]
MKYPLTWDEAKQQSNLQKHGLDFSDAVEVLESRYRMDTKVIRQGEMRIQSISYVTGVLAVLTVIHIERDHITRIISFRHASTHERETYYDWLENKYDDS